MIAHCSVVLYHAYVWYLELENERLVHTDALPVPLYISTSPIMHKT